MADQEQDGETFSERHPPCERCSMGWHLMSTHECTCWCSFYDKRDAKGWRPSFAVKKRRPI